MYVPIDSVIPLIYLVQKTSKLKSILVIHGRLNFAVFTDRIVFIPTLIIIIIIIIIINFIWGG